MNTLTLIRGLPGSGKTTLALELTDTYTVCLEADSYFYDDYGNYVFDANQLKQAHEACQNETERKLGLGYSVLVSNTFTTLSEMKPYFLMAKKLRVPFNVITCQGSFGNVHAVPDETLNKMQARFFHGPVIKELEKLYGI